MCVHSGNWGQVKCWYLISCCSLLSVYSSICQCGHCVSVDKIKLKYATWNNKRVIFHLRAPDKNRSFHSSELLINLHCEVLVLVCRNFNFKIKTFHNYCPPFLLPARMIKMAFKLCASPSLHWIGSYFSLWLSHSTLTAIISFVAEFSIVDRQLDTETNSWNKAAWEHVRLKKQSCSAGCLSWPLHH